MDNLKTYTATDADGQMTLRTVDNSHIESLKVYFEAEQLGSGTPAADNVRPFQGRTNLTLIEHTSDAKNLLYDWDNFRWVNSYEGTLTRHFSYSGVEIELSSGNGNGGYSLILPANTTVTFSFDINYTPVNGFIRQRIFIVKNNTSSRVANTIITSTHAATTYTTSEAGTYLFTFYAQDYENEAPNGKLKITNWQVEYGADESPYESYYNKIYNIDWEAQAGPLYGGYYDLVTGEVVETHAHAVITDTSNFSYGNLGNMYNTFNFDPEDLGLSSSYPAATPSAKSNYLTLIYTGDIVDNLLYGRLVGYMPTSVISSAADWEPYLAAHPLEICYKLNTPNVYQLPQTPMYMHDGENNFWTFTGDDIELEVMREVAAEKSNMVAFNAAATSPLKSCIVELVPNQLGSGDPSLENVRSIEGYGGIELNNAGKNVGHIVGYSAYSVDSLTTARGTSGSYGQTISTIDYALPDTSVTITQSTYNNTVEISNYRNGYMAVIIDNLIFEERYDFSFKVTDITSNSLNATLSDIKIQTPYGSLYGPAEVKDNIVIFKNIKWKQNTNSPNNYCLSIRNCGMSCTISEIMVTPANTNDGIFEPYNNHKTSIPFNETIYGGYVDVANGTFVKSWASVDLGSLNWSVKDTTGDYNYFYSNSLDTLINITDYPYNEIFWYTSHFTSVGGGMSRTSMGTTSTNNILTITMSGHKGSVVIRNDEFTDKADFKNWVSGKQLVYPLATPITYQLSPREIHTLLGANSIWTSANNNIQLTYFTKDYAVGNPVKYISDGVKPINSLIVKMRPIQDSYNEPSLSSANEIISWAGFDFFRTGAEIPITFTDFQTIQADGATIEYLEDGSLYVNGTLNSACQFTFTIENFTLEKNQRYEQIVSFTSADEIGAFGRQFNNSEGTYPITFIVNNVNRYFNNRAYSFFSLDSTQTFNKVIFVLGTGISNAIIKYQLFKVVDEPDYFLYQWDKNNETYYGEYNVITGQLQNRWYLLPTDTNDIRWSWYDFSDRSEPFGCGIRFRAPMEGYDLSKIVTCDKLKIKYEVENSDLPYLYVTPTDNSRAFAIIFPGTLNDFPELTNPSDIIGVIKQYIDDNDIHVYLNVNSKTASFHPPTTYSTSMGTNLLISDTNSPIEVTYELHEGPEMITARKRVVENSPHLETQTNNIIHFEKGFPTLLEECKVNFICNQIGSGDPSVNNIRPISGYTGMNLHVTNENFFSFSDCNTITKGSNTNYSIENNVLTITAKGTSTTNVGTQVMFQYNVPPHLKNKELYFIGNGITNSNSNHAAVVIAEFRDINNTLLYDPTVYGVTARPYGRAVTVPADAAIIRVIFRMSQGTNTYTAGDSVIFNGFSINYPSTNNSYIQYKGNIQTIDWTSIAGEAYGGYVDLAKGELVVTHGIHTTTWGDYDHTYDSMSGGNQVFTNYERRCFTTNTTFKVLNNITTSFCNVSPYTKSAAYNADAPYFVMGVNTAILKLPVGTSNDLQLQFVSELATPITYQLTPAQIKTLYGINNIWSDLNDNIEAKYWTL